MNNQLIELLSEMSDEDFYELTTNIGISIAIRELMEGKAPFGEAEIMRRLDLTPLDLNYALNGAFEFTTRHSGVVVVMQQEKQFYEIESDDDTITEEDAELNSTQSEHVDITNDVPDHMDYGILQENNHHNHKKEEDKEETMEELQDRIFREHQEKAKGSEDALGLGSNFMEFID